MDHQCWVLTKCGVHPRDQKIPLLGECCLWLSGVWLVVSSSSLLREEKEKKSGSEDLDKLKQILHNQYCDKY